MKQKLAGLVCRFGAQLCAAAMLIAPLASEVCKRIYYQPEEPEELADFVKSRKSK